MKCLFPSLFSNVDNSNFKCDICILAKIHQVHFPISLNKSNILVALIHSDVLGPSPITTTFGIVGFLFL